ncbi:hypothetical protein CEXT_103171 [Caerostris extrusa]|uniref:C2H2-type domain-containing protein n=1 Tax=Caerostris extrusa TaxID=172846 RepID=A0AAV4X747_CAEEX|nr:hypothetical protein CEXT_103171 [Caerostris extrusa]
MLKKTKGLGWWVAVIGDTQQDFFEYCGLPVMDMNTLWKCPEYEKLPTPDQPLLKRCAAIHLDDDSRCSKRMAYNLARYLERRAKEEETREYSIVDFKNADAASWAAIVAKPAISTTQPWAGLPLTPHTSFSSTPRRPGQTRPSQADGSAAKGGSPHNALPPVQHVRKKITFKNDCEEPEAVSHVVLLPQRQIKKRRRNFPCLHCNFTFRTLKSRDDHLVVHVLEEQFNKLHGLVSNTPSLEFDNFVLPKTPPF